jgi:hypothetical protein
VLCRQCFKAKRAPNVATPATMNATAELVADASKAPAATERPNGSTEISATTQPSQA